MALTLPPSVAFPVWGDWSISLLLWSDQDHSVQNHPALEAAVWHSHPGTVTNQSWTYGKSWGGASPPLSSPWIPRNGYGSRCASTQSVQKRNIGTNPHSSRINKLTRDTQSCLFMSPDSILFPMLSHRRLGREGKAFSHKFGKKEDQNSIQQISSEKHKHISWTLHL